MANSLSNATLETEGNEVATGFQADKDRAVRCWIEAVDASGLDDKVLAIECGMSKGYYSKVAAGEQGDLLGLVYRLPKERASLRADFFARLAAAERVDLESAAAEQLIVAAVRFLSARGLPAKTFGPIKADLHPSSKARTA